ncbi:MAG: hypothetical protein MJZ76_07530 [Bacteroidales bacterium]|nr:hypothetical protein [Bacteroidales bacterium]
MPSGVFVAGLIICSAKNRVIAPQGHLTSAAGARYSGRALLKKVVLSQPLQVGQKGKNGVCWIIHSVAFLEFLHSKEKAV